MIKIKKIENTITFIEIQTPRQESDETEVMHTLNELLGRESFVLVMEVHGPAAFSPETKKALGVWFKESRPLLKKKCRAFIRVAPQSSKMERLKGRALRLAMPCPYYVFQKKEEALKKASQFDGARSDS